MTITTTTPTFMVVFRQDGAAVLHQSTCPSIRNTVTNVQPLSFGGWRLACGRCKPDVAMAEGERDRLDAERIARSNEIDRKFEADRYERLHPYLALRDRLAISWPEVRIQDWNVPWDRTRHQVRITTASWAGMDITVEAVEGRLIIVELNHGSSLIRTAADAFKVADTIFAIEAFNYVKGA